MPSLHFFSKNYSIKPTLISGAAALAMLTPLYVRGILRWRKSIYGLIVFVLLWTVYSGDHIHRPKCQFGYPRISCCGGDALVLARDSWCGRFCVDPCLRGLHISDREHECSDERLWLSLCRLRLPGVHPSRRAESGGFRQECQRRIPRQNKPARERIGEDVSAAGELGKRFL
ncbi:hypothetical protein [Paracoccus versutus]